MSRAVYASLVASALVLALAFRLAALDRRPMHHDEANQALKFGALLETGEYRYDPSDHHGPTLYYLTLPAAWFRGQATLASLDERTLRLVPALFGAGLILLLPLFAAGLGRPATAASALLVAVSPALAYYSRFYIQETLFVFFVAAFVAALGRYVVQPTASWAAAAGISAGLAYATKETSIVVLPAAVAAAVLARISTSKRGAARGTISAVHVLIGAVSGIAVAFVLYTSFFQNTGGFAQSVAAFGTYGARGIEAGAHTQAWHYYLGLLAYFASGGLIWTEGAVLLLALVGLIAAFMKAGVKAGLKACPAGSVVTPGSMDAHAEFWPRYIAIYSLLAAAAFSAIRYKTPWNLLPFYVGFVLLAGWGAAELFARTRSRTARVVLAVALVAAVSHLGVENWRANFRYPADPRNPFVYAQTVPDLLRLVQRVDALAAIHTDRAAMLVEVVAGPEEQWPLPWYLRRMTRVGYWPTLEEPGRPADAPVLIASEENAGRLDARLGDRYVSEFYGLRPGVLLTMFVEHGLWERFLSTTSSLAAPRTPAAPPSR